MSKILTFFRRRPRLSAGLAVAILLPGYLLFRGGSTADIGITFTVKPGPLDITVLEGGSIEALSSQEIRSEIKGSQGTKILKIVEEGYQVTDEDVKNAKVLVELDSSDLKQRLAQQEIQFQSTLASLTEATQAYEIQRNQNISTIKAAEQKAQFARMDTEKFLGDKASGEIVKTLKLDKLAYAASLLPSAEDSEQFMLMAMETNETNVVDEAESSTEPEKDLKSDFIPVSNKPRSKPPMAIDFTKYAKTDLLGDGSAMQQLRKLIDEVQGAQQQLGLSETKLRGTRRLYESNFVTKTELDTEEISFRNNELKVQTAETAHNLFIKYEFPKQAQELVSKYEEALRSLEREKKEAISRLAQAQARLKGAESRYNIEYAQRKDLLDQIDKCIITAQKPGLVVYGGGSSEGYNTEQIREGATIRERQPIITIPDMSQMAVKVKIHESYIQKVQKSCKAEIVADAFPNRKLTGEVAKVALLPDSQNRWVNPDMKVYQTVVNIDGTHDWLKPGMSAKVEILVKQLANVMYVPLQCVSEIDEKHFCYVGKVRVERRQVEVGDFNDSFIEIKSGLSEGDEVLLRAPAESESKRKESLQKKRPATSPVSTNAVAGSFKPSA